MTRVRFPSFAFKGMQMKIIFFITLLTFCNITFAQTISIYNDKCKTCHQSPNDLFNKNLKTNNLSKTIENMFKNQSLMIPTKSQLINMNKLGNSLIKNKSYIEIYQIDKQIKGETSKFLQIELIKNNKMIQTRCSNDGTFTFDKTGDYLVIINNKTKIKIPIKIGSYVIN